MENLKPQVSHLSRREEEQILSKLEEPLEKRAVEKILAMRKSGRLATGKIVTKNKKMYHLEIAPIRLGRIPEVISVFSQIEELVISNCHIRQIENLDQIPTLKWLDFI